MGLLRLHLKVPLVRVIDAVLLGDVNIGVLVLRRNRLPIRIVIVGHLLDSVFGNRREAIGLSTRVASVYGSNVRSLVEDVVFRVIASKERILVGLLGSSEGSGSVRIPKGGRRLMVGHGGCWCGTGMIWLLF